MTNPTSADNLRNRFAWNGSVDFQYVKSQLSGESDPFVRKLTTFLNSKVNSDGSYSYISGVLEGEEYVELRRLSPRQKALLDDLRQKSPRFARFKHLATQVLADCKNNATCNQQKEDAKKRIAAGDWDSIDILPNLAEQRESLDLTIQLLSFDPALVTGFGFGDGFTNLPGSWGYPVRGGVVHNLFRKNRARITESFALSERGRSESEAGNHQSAVDSYADAARLDPSFHNDLGRELLATGKRDKGIEMLDLYVKVSGEPVAAKVAAAAILEKAAIRADTPENAKTRLLEKARYHYIEAIGLVPNRADLFSDASMISGQLGNKMEAAASSLQATSLDPNNAIYHFKLGLDYLELDGETDEAIAELEKALELGLTGDQATAACHLWLGRAYAKRSNYRQALACFGRAMVYNPQIAGTASREAAEVLMSSEQYAEAIPHLKRAIAHNADSKNMLFGNLGKAHAKLGQREEAITALREAVKGTKKDYQAVLDERFLLARLLKESGRLREAVEQAKAVAELMPDDSSCLLLYGLLTAATGDLIVAEVALRKVFDKTELSNQLGADDREKLATTLERVLRRQGKKTEADAVHRIHAQQTLGVEQP